MSQWNPDAERPCPNCHGWGIVNETVVRCSSCARVFPAKQEVEDDLCPHCGARHCLGSRILASDALAHYGPTCLTGVPTCSRCHGTGEGRDLFPILQENVIPGVPRAVSWLLVELHEAQAEANHGQSLNRLAARDGLTARELAAVINDVPSKDVKGLSDKFICSMIVAAEKRCREHEKTLNAARERRVEHFLEGRPIDVKKAVREFATTVLNA